MSASQPDPKSDNEIRLRVEEALSRDRGTGKVRLPISVMKKIGLEPGDIIEIKGKKITGGKVLPLGPDEKDDIIRLDGLTRRNCGSSMGETVIVRKINPRGARSISIAPVDEDVRITGSVQKIREALLNRPVHRGDIISIVANISKKMSPSDPTSIFSAFFGQGQPLNMRETKVIVTQTDPDGIVLVKKDTDITILATQPPSLKGLPTITYDDIGGLKEEIRRMREMIELPLKYPELFERLGIDPPKGVLLYGPPGTGKTLLAKAVANESNANFIAINGPEIMSKFYGESEKRLRELFEQAEKKAPSLIFIDEIDSIAPKREEVMGEVERRVVAQLLSLMDGLKSRGRVIVIGATNRPNSIDPALRRPGRFDREIEIGIPDKEGRFEILMIHTRGMPLDESVDLKKLVDRTHGFVGADLAALTREAAMQTLRRVLPSIDLEKEEIPEEVMNQLIVTKEDFDNALKYVRPSALREVFVSIPEVKWDDIGGVDKAKQLLREAVELPLKHPEVFEYHGIKPPKGILLFGAPGTGKTLLAKAVASESEANFISVKGPEIFNMYVGESEIAVREIFRKARMSAPAVIGIDEIDSIAARRGSSPSSHVMETVVTQLLSEMDGLEELAGVVVIATTNRPELVDSALLRSGRFDRLVHVPIPDKNGRLEILRIHTKKMRLADDVDLEKLAEQTEGYVGSDLENLCREAVMIAIREDLTIKQISMRHFLDALEVVPPSSNRQQAEHYERLARELLQRSAQISKPPSDYAI